MATTTKKAVISQFYVMSPGEQVQIVWMRLRAVKKKQRIFVMG